MDPLGPGCWAVGPPWIRPAPARLTGALSVWDLGNLEARSTPSALFVFLKCVGEHCPAGGPLPSGSVVVMKGGYLVHNSGWMDGLHQVAFT